MSVVRRLEHSLKNSVTPGPQSYRTFGPCSISFQIVLKAGFRDSHASGKGDFGEVVAVQTADVGLVGRRQRFLGLNHFDVIYNARGKPVASLLKRLCGEIQSALGNSDLLGCGLQIEKGVPDVLINLSSQVLQP